MFATLWFCMRIPKPRNLNGLRGFFVAPAGTRTPDTLLKRQVLYLLSYWGRSSEQASDRPASAQARKLAPSAAPPLKTEPAALGFSFGKRGYEGRLSPNRIRRIRFGKEEGGRSSAVFAMPRGNGADRASSDVAGMAGLEPTISESKSGVLPLHYIPVSCQKRPAQPASICLSGVGYGARTHDTRNHNPVLCQLS